MDLQIFLSHKVQKWMCQSSSLDFSEIKYFMYCTYYFMLTGL